MTWLEYISKEWLPIQIAVVTQNVNKSEMNIPIAVKNISRLFRFCSFCRSVTLEISPGLDARSPPVVALFPVLSTNARMLKGV